MKITTETAKRYKKYGNWASYQRKRFLGVHRKQACTLPLSIIVTLPIFSLLQQTGTPLVIVQRLLVCPLLPASSSQHGSQLRWRRSSAGAAVE